ncbi:MAG: pyridoxamine 5'-phosphate oxidase family protein [Alphaproteobacteria bacterium]|nr:pyridoxamine 5'-phosphate oxidase family protein [Alphaproteobacteria bacterium]
MMRAADHATLATLMPGTMSPYTSLVTVATDHDGTPLLLLSDIADHAANIALDPRVSLLFIGLREHENPQQWPRVSIVGHAERSDTPRHRARFLARHPEAARYADFGDFGFYRVIVERAHFVGGFARASWLDPSLLVSEAAAAIMAEAEMAILEQLNTEHRPLLAQCAGAASLRQGNNWIMTALDTDGFDLSVGKRIYRIAFETPVHAPEAVLPTLQAMAERQNSLHE